MKWKKNKELEEVIAALKLQQENPISYEKKVEQMKRILESRKRRHSIQNISDVQMLQRCDQQLTKKNKYEKCDFGKTKKGIQLTK